MYNPKLWTISCIQICSGLNNEAWSEFKTCFPHVAEQINQSWCSNSLLGARFVLNDCRVNWDNFSILILVAGWECCVVVLDIHNSMGNPGFLQHSSLVVALSSCIILEHMEFLSQTLKKMHMSVQLFTGLFEWHGAQRWKLWALTFQPGLWCYHHHQ